MPTTTELDDFRRLVRSGRIGRRPDIGIATGTLGESGPEKFGIGLDFPENGERIGPTPLEVAAEHLVGTDTDPFSVAKHAGARTLEAAGKILGLLAVPGENIMRTGKAFGEILGRPEGTIGEAAKKSLIQLLTGAPKAAYQQLAEGKPSDFPEISKDIQKFVPEIRPVESAFDPLYELRRAGRVPRWMPGGILTWIGEGSPAVGAISIAGDPLAPVGVSEVAGAAKAARRGLLSLVSGKAAKTARAAKKADIPFARFAPTIREAAEDIPFARVPSPEGPIKTTSPITDPWTGYPIFRQEGIPERTDDVAIILGGPHPRDIPGVQQRSFVDRKVAEAARTGKLDDLRRLYTDPDATVDRYARQRIAEAEEIITKAPSSRSAIVTSGRQAALPIELPAPPRRLELEEYRPSQREFHEAHAALEAELSGEREAARAIQRREIQEEALAAGKAGAARLREAEKPIAKPGIFKRASDLFVDLKNKATRAVPALDEKKHGAVVDALRQLGHASGYASDRAQRTVESVLSGLDAKQRQLFNDAVVAADFEHDIGLGREVPFFDTPDAFASWHENVRKQVETSAPVRRAMERRARLTDAIREDLIRAAADIGLDYSHLRSNPSYFRHLVREYLEDRLAGGIRKTGRPTGGGYLKAREGTTKDILANYSQAEYEIVNRMLRDTEMAGFIKKVIQAEDIRPALELQAQATGNAWENMVPKTHVKWNPGGSKVFDALYPADYRVAEDVLRKASDSLGIKPDTMENLIGKIGGGRDAVVPREVATALDDFAQRPSRVPVLSAATSAWKQWILGNPWTALKYNLRNLLGDAEAVAVGNPSAFRKVGRAAREVWGAVRRGEVTPELQEWMRRGGFTATQTAQELGDIAGKRSLATVGFLPEGKIAGAATRLARLPAQVSEAREAVLRYAAYLDYLEQIRSTGKPKNYGASIRQAVDAIPDARDKAAKLANDLLGAYDQVTALGKNIRQNLIPFYSWLEVNATRSYRMLMNAAEDGALASALGRKMGMKTVGAAATAGSILIKMAALTGAVTAWNKTVMRDEEDDLPDYIKNQPHVTLGRNKEGEPRYLTGLSAFGDLLSWFRIESTLPLVREWTQGRAGIGDVARHAGLSPLNRVVSGVNPIFKAPFEALAGKELYPDAFEPRKIRDTATFLFKTVNLDEEYKLMTGQSQRPYAEKWKDLLWNSIDPGKGDYDRIMEAKQNFMENVLRKPDIEYSFSPKGNALYNYKLAVRYGDESLKSKWLEAYKALGGTPRGLERSFGNMHPLFGMSKTESLRFLESLSTEDRRSYERAIRFYETTLRGKRFDPKTDTPQPQSPPPDMIVPSASAPTNGRPDVEEFREKIRAGGR